jgi:hypothetical protein
VCVCVRWRPGLKRAPLPTCLPPSRPLAGCAAALVDVPLSELLERLPIDRADAEALEAFFSTGAPRQQQEEEEVAW